MRPFFKTLAVCALALNMNLAFGAKNIELPSTLAMTAYGTSSSGYTEMVSIGNLLKDKYGTSVRILPGQNDVSRMTPLRTGRVSLCACGIASYFASEGVFLFASPDWGPQPVRVILTSIGDLGVGVGAAGDAGIKTPADLKGKRVPFVRGSDAVNVAIEAFLAFGGLTWDDVKKVIYPGYKSHIDGAIADRSDVVFGTTISPNIQRLAASPRGIVWPRMDPNDKKAWSRLKAIAPYFQPHEATAVAGKGYGPDHPWVGETYPYPILLASDNADDKTVYNLIKVLIEDYDEYKDAAPGNAGYALDRQNLKWVIPLHDSVVRYYKEIGRWTDAMQAHQDRLVKRQKVLAKAWDAYTGNNPPNDEAAFKKGWMAARADALTAQDMKPVFQ